MKTMWNNKPYYSISMFPYPSGDIHMGHFRNFCAQDFFNRYQLMNGREVLSFLGWDAFGLPAENAAIERKISAKDWTENNISSMNKVIDLFGNYYTESKQVITCRPDYYLHQQKIFMWLYEAGLFYKKKSFVNWDPVDKTVLANEQVKDGKGWRSGAIIEKKEMEQWFFRITQYADELLENVTKLDWPDRIINAQVQWIGKSYGYEIEFPVIDSQSVIKVFTTQPHTIKGVRFIVVSPFSEYGKLLESNSNLMVFNKYNNTKIPVYFADYVVDEYGTGAVMGVPNDDERDRKFAIQNNISFGDYEPLYNIINELPRKLNYRLRDWCIERQRRWGCPIPIIYCAKCGVILSNKPFLIEDPIEVECHQCHSIAKREMSTMDTFVDSSWYFLRYLCSDNKDEPFDNRVRPVDLYIGGAEHATLHLIYARAIVKALRDLGKLNFDEPFIKLINQGMVLANVYRDESGKPVDLSLVIKGEDGKWYNKSNQQQVFLCENAKMSKSLRNVVSPKEIVDQYGIDACRLFVASNSLIVDMDWNTNELNGCKNFLTRLTAMCENVSTQEWIGHDDGLYLKAHELLKAANDDMASFKVNCAIARVRTLFNELDEKIRNDQKSRTFVWVLGKLLIALWPVCPDLCFEQYEKIFASHITLQRNYYDHINCKRNIRKIRVYMNGKPYGEFTDIRTPDVLSYVISQMNIDTNHYNCMYIAKANIVQISSRV
jgi:leucyl-tRNA synthetase